MTKRRNQEEIREVIGLPEKENFFDRLYDRLYTAVERFVFIDNPKKFTLFITALPRDKKMEVSDSNYNIAYQGIKKQQEFLGKSEQTDYLAKHWNSLENNSYGVAEMKISQEVFDEFRHLNSNEFEKCYVSGTLKKYFIDPEKFTEYQKHEYPILNKYFDITKDRFISVPLIQFGEIDGVIHIIYENSGHEKFYNIKDAHSIDDNIKDLIAGFSIEYEGVMFSWHLSMATYDLNEGITKAVERVGKKFNDEDKQEINPVYEDFWGNKANAILRILNYQEYYTTHYRYFTSRIEQHREIMIDRYKSVLRQAVITVLLDSYAHNISAHALTTLSWIYSKRAEIFARKETRNIIHNMIHAYSARFKDIEKYEETYAYLVNRDGPVPLELYPLFKFLQEKGGFWSGLTRDMNPGGLTTDMFDVLWDGFACNALYLGTIVESEDIRKLHLHVTIYRPEGQTDGFITTPEIEFEGRLSTVDLEHWIDHKYDREKDDCYVDIGEGRVEDRLWYRKHPEMEPLSRFIQPGLDFASLKTWLRSLRVFLPGGVVGKHALYNIFENELRNIKHFTGPELANAQQEGLTFHIAIQPASLDKGQHGELYRVGVWLGLSTPLQKTGHSNKRPTYLIKRRFDALWNDIIDSENDFQPHIGGNSQDKVCAAMLFNGSFSSVQNGSRVWIGLQIGSVDKLERDKAFYPWITPAVASKKTNKEFQIKPPGGQFDVASNEGYFRAQRSYLRDFKEEEGFLKKYFYIWKGHDVLIDSRQASPWENATRFRIVYAQDDTQIPNLRQSGILRALPKPPGAFIQAHQEEQTPLGRQRVLFEAYKEWLCYWLKEERIVFVLKNEKENYSGLLIFDKQHQEVLRFFTDKKLSSKADFSIAQSISFADLKNKIENEVAYTTLHYAHASELTSPEALLYRKHGIMNRYFTPLNETTKMNLKDMSAERFAEWFEMMVTRICIIDSRIQHRMRLSGREPQFFRNEAQILFCGEDEPHQSERRWRNVWEDDITKKFVVNCHFLVMHLSFIERLLQNKYNNHEGDIGLFMEKELLPLWPNHQLPHNFILVVTSGRGRSKWWNTFKSNAQYKPFIPHIIFRSIESLLSAVEGSATQKDDFELKYRFTKVLFGS